MTHPRWYHTIMGLLLLLSSTIIAGAGHTVPAREPPAPPVAPAIIPISPHFRMLQGSIVGASSGITILQSPSFQQRLLLGEFSVPTNTTTLQSANFQFQSGTLSQMPRCIQIVRPDTSGLLRPVSGAHVYRNGRFAGTTNTGGCIARPASLRRGDQLVALVPSEHHRLPEYISPAKYTIYETSLNRATAEPWSNPATINTIRLAIHPEQTLTLFHLTAALEWANPRPDELRLVTETLRIANARLLNATDGQIGLGTISITTDPAQRKTADILVAAAHDTVAHAPAYGIVSRPITRTWSLPSTMLTAWGRESIPFGPGQIVIPRPRPEKADEHSYAVAHELIHYLLGSIDDHLGWQVNEQGDYDLVSLDPPCLIHSPQGAPIAPNSASPKLPEGSQARFPPLWSSKCTAGANYMLFGGGLWETWRELYPHVRTPAERGAVLLGPTTPAISPTVEAPPMNVSVPQTVMLPLALEANTRIEQADLYVLQDDRILWLGHPAVSATVIAPFSLPGRQEGATLIASARARYRNGEQLTYYGATQGIPSNDTFMVPLTPQRLKGVAIDVGTNALTVTTYVTSTAGLAPVAQVYDSGVRWGSAISMQAGHDSGGAFFTAVVPLPSTFEEGFIAITAPDGAQQQTRIIPVTLFDDWPASIHWIEPKGKHDHAFELYGVEYEPIAQAHTVPQSSDAASAIQLAITPDDAITDLAEGHIIAAYRVASSSPVRFRAGTLLFHVPPGVQGTFHVYQRPSAGAPWQLLPSTSAPENGVVSVGLTTPGTYALVRQYDAFFPLVPRPQPVTSLPPIDRNTRGK